MKCVSIAVLAAMFLVVSCGVDSPTSDQISSQTDRALTVWETPEDYFAAKVLPNLTKYCGLCHANPTPDYATAKSMITPGDPDNSYLYLTTAGKNSHRKVWAEGSEKLNALKTWIEMEK